MSKTVSVSNCLLTVSLLTAMTACHRDATGDDGDAAFAPTPARLLSTGSPGKDEDPSVMSAADGSIRIAWFSDRTGSGDIYVSSIDHGTAWRDPVRVTFSTEGDFNPHLIQDRNGMFHLTWFRWSAPFVGHIMYNHSADGLTWDPTTEVQVTTAADVDDWVPTIAETADGALVVVFASAKRTPANPVTDLYVSRKPAATDSWSSPVAPSTINDPAIHDHLPYVRRVGDRLSLVWVRHDTSQPLPWLNARSDVFYATSIDGLQWSSPVQVTKETGAVVNLFPAIWVREGDDASVLWLSTRSGAPRPYEIPTRRVAEYPTGVAPMLALGDGYSHRVVLTPTPGIVLGVWVSGPEGAQDIMYRFYRQ